MREAHTAFTHHTEIFDAAASVASPYFKTKLFPTYSTGEKRPTPGEVKHVNSPGFTAFVWEVRDVRVGEEKFVDKWIKQMHVAMICLSAHGHP